MEGEMTVYVCFWISRSRSAPNEVGEPDRVFGNETDAQHYCEENVGYEYVAMRVE
jgi:hypothetical protein